MEPDRIEVLRLEDGHLALRRYQHGLLCEAIYVAKADLLAQLAAWHLAEALQAAGRVVRDG